MNLRRPNEQLANCCWLPRIIDKARADQSGHISLLYKIAFGSRLGVDGHFLRHFSLSKADIIKATKTHQSDPSIEHWFLSQPCVNKNSISQWNRFARTLGQKGQTGHRTFHLLKYLMYPKSVKQPVNSIFEAIDQDESD